MKPEITVEPLTAARWGLVSELFAVSPGIDECWCMWPRRSRGTHTADRSANRAAMKALLDAGDSPGLIALGEARAVGWCAVGPRETYPQYEPTTDRSTHWAIACLYVHRAADHASVASALIDAAVRLASENDAVAVEGPPPYWFPGDASVIAKVERAFLANGFEQVGPGARISELRRVLDTDQ